MELIDILDEKGNKTGERKSKIEVHAKGLWHRGVHIWFANSKGEILLQRRVESKENYPDFWDISAAGHISAGEDDETSALREIEEELGVKIFPGDLVKIGNVKEQVVLNNNTYFDNEHHSIYLVRKDVKIEDLKMQTSEVKDLRWISAGEFKKWVSGQTDQPVVPHPEEYKLLFQALQVEE